MKYLIFTIVLVGLANIVYGEDITRNSIITFQHDVELRDGQKSLLVLDRQCRLHLPTEVIGRQKIDEGTALVVSKIEAKPESMSRNPVSGDPIRVLPSLKIKLVGKNTKIVCRGEEANHLDKEAFEADGMFRVTLPEVTSYEF